MSYPDTPAPIVFFDGQCPLCRREIEYYKTLDGADHLRWVDLHNDKGMLKRHGLDKQSAMERFHVLDAGDQWQTGAYGFIEMWSHLPRWRVLARTLKRLKLASLLDWAYGHFARWRLGKRCAEGQCQMPEQ